MEIDFTTALGLTAGVVSTIAFLPQLIKTWQSKSAQDLSWTMLVVLCTGISMWLVYGIVISDLPVIASNAVLLCLVSVILILKIRFS